MLRSDLVRQARSRVRRALTPSPRAVVDLFQRNYYESLVWQRTYWLGVPAQKCPFDLWIYQELLSEIRPDVVVETGTYSGGSALFMASVCDLLGRGEIVTVDIEERPGRPAHKRIRYISGSSTSEEVVERVRALVSGKRAVMVVLDSDHRKEHVDRELDIYSELVTPGSYLIVEDTNINGHPVEPQFGPGPMEAVREFLARNRAFVADLDREKFYVTFNPSGYLRKVG